LYRDDFEGKFDAAEESLLYRPFLKGSMAALSVGISGKKLLSTSFLREMYFIDFFDSLEIKKSLIFHLRNSQSIFMAEVIPYLRTVLSRVNQIEK